jgi:hypothetical protein
MPFDLRIASPCTESWNSMVGDERVRHCGKCRLNVFNFKELSEQEVRDLLVKTQGRVCARLYRRADGTVLTKDCPTGVAALRKKVFAAVTMSVALLLGVVGWRLGKSRECATGSNETWFDRVVTSRFIDAREELRGTRTFGPMVNELWPQDVVMGAMVALPPPPPTPGAP